MSHIHLYRISQDPRSFRLYSSFKKKSRKNREKIRMQLKFMRRQHIHLQKEIWQLIIDEIPDTNDTNDFKQVIDFKPCNMELNEFIELLHKQ